MFLFSKKRKNYGVRQRRIAENAGDAATITGVLFY
jgi:hypothetical protein